MTLVDRPTLLERLEHRGNTEPAAPLLTAVDDDGRDGRTVTAGELLSEAQAVAAQLLGAGGMRPGEAVLLAYPPGMPFVTTLVACLLAGIVAVPVAPPDPLAPGDDLARLQHIAATAEARVALAPWSYAWAARLASWTNRSAWPVLRWVTVDRLPASTGALPPAASPDQVALLQFTSGSTAHPRGARLTHGNLAHQLDACGRALGASREARMVMWLPHHHDFGLISGLLSALWGNGRLWFLSPLAFLRRPAVWLEVASRVGATHLAAPNFAYDLVTRRTTPAGRARWDLSRVKVAMVAAEPVRHETLEAFAAAFAVAGFPSEALAPAYGLAEHTVGVTVGGRASFTVDAAALERVGIARPGVDRTLRGCGRPLDGVTLRIVDPETRMALPEGRVGEIWVRSPSVARGYAGPDPGVFGALLADDDSGLPFLRTGDLGFVREGELYVTGRRKDLVVMRGRKLHAEDLEQTVREAHPAIRPGGLAVFGVPGPAEVGERMIALVEVREELADAELPAVAAAVRAAVRSRHQLPVHEVVLGGRKLVPRTTSSKPRRAWCRERYLAGTLEEVRRTVSTGSPLDDTPALEIEHQESATRLHAAELAAIRGGLRSAETLSAETLSAETVSTVVAAVLDGLRSAVGRALERELDAVDVDVPIRSLGLDSVAAVDLAVAVQEATGHPEMERLLLGPGSLRELAVTLSSWMQTR